MKIFFNVPNPVDDETFSSWLFRCSSSRLTVISDRGGLLARPDWTWSGGLIKFDDPDFDVNTEFFNRACDIVRIDKHLAAILFQFHDKEVVSWEHRCWFCPECLRDDVKEGRTPAWRKTWCSSHSVFCMIHKVELVKLKGRPSYSKAWDAYVQICNQNLIASTWSTERFVRLRIIFFNRIKRWLSVGADSGEINEIQDRLFRRLFRVFLQLPTQRRDAGIARTFFHQGRMKKHTDLITFKENLHLCHQISEPRSRFGCMMLLGILLEIIPQIDSLIFQRYCEAEKVYFPDVLGIENTIYFGAINREDYKFLHGYLGLFPRRNWPRLDAFLTQQDDRYQRAGVCSGMMLGESL
ncbi:hypothetical protein [Pseudomonas jessenii]|uniref:hypothetical protein n=1 Tax=Pseudomonas jessenii TaxID=77298 RepID=UPI0032E4C774